MADVVLRLAQPTESGSSSVSSSCPNIAVQADGHLRLDTPGARAKIQLSLETPSKPSATKSLPIARVTEAYKSSQSLSAETPSGPRPQIEQTEFEQQIDKWTAHRSPRIIILANERGEMARERNAMAREGDVMAREGDEMAREGDEMAREGDEIVREGDVTVREGDVTAREGDEMECKRRDQSLRGTTEALLVFIQAFMTSLYNTKMVMSGKQVVQWIKAISPYHIAVAVMSFTAIFVAIWMRTGEEPDDYIDQTI